jgi:transcriptional antiterminator NusG
MGKQEWYFLRVQVGREDTIRQSMIRRLKQAGIEALVPQIVVPTETIADHRAGKKIVKRKKLYPGYLMVEMELSDDVWFILRETPGFGDFVGGQSQPTPANLDDVEKVLAHMDSSKEQPKVAVRFQKGDRVKIKTGAFENTDAVVEEVHTEKGTLDVSVNFFGRPTPMSLGYWEVESI